MRKHSPIRRAVVVAIAALACALGPAAGDALAAAGAAYVPGQVIIGYRSVPSPALRSDVATIARAPLASAVDPQSALVDVPPGQTVAGTIARLRRVPGVAYAVPNYLAHAAGGWIPNDPGRGPGSRDWQRVQWNFLPGTGVDAPTAWAELLHDAASGGAGSVVAVLDTGVAYTDWTDPRTGVAYLRSPDFNRTRFAAPCDLLRDRLAGAIVHHHVVRACTHPEALDRNGHGTVVAGVVAESTNNGLGLTGLAYGATIIPLRVLDAEGNGDSLTIARGIRYAVVHGARVINLSLEFTPNGPAAVRAADIPDVLQAIAFAHHHGVVVVAAAGNDSLSSQIAYPAADQPDVISVGATTRDGCVANYSNGGAGLDLVAPGGGQDADVPGDPNCHPDRYLRGGDIYQMTFPDAAHPGRFGLPSGWFGTSMAAPEVAGVAALVIASGVLGAHPTPDRVLARLELTAHPLGSGHPNAAYGYGLLDAGAAAAGPSSTAAARRRAALRRRHRHPRFPAA